MKNTSGKAKALFIAPDGNFYPDDLVCSGKLFGGDGPTCPFAQDGRLPVPQPLDSHASDYTLDKGKDGDLCPPCVKHQLGNLGHWDGHRGQKFPEELKPLRLFKCSRWYWLVVLGLHHENPTKIEP